MLDASMYVGMHTTIPTQSEAMCHAFHVRRSQGIGAKS
jgi:hypothetical protein